MATERERDAVELLDRIYGRKADHPLHDAGMVEDWMDKEIMAFIRKHGSFAEQLRTLADGSERTS